MCIYLPRGWYRTVCHQRCDSMRHFTNFGVIDGSNLNVCVSMPLSAVPVTYGCNRWNIVHALPSPDFILCTQHPTAVSFYVLSFCIFLIFLSCDEPTVILDTLADWRFAKNVRENAANTCVSATVDALPAICDRESPHSILRGCTTADPGRI